MNDELDTSHDPPRLDLSDDAPELAAQAMRAARSDVPEPEDLSRMEALLMARIAALGAGGAGGAGTAGSGGASGASGAGATGGVGTSASSVTAAGTSAAVGGTGTFATLAGGVAVLALVGAAFVGKSWMAGSAPAPAPSGMTSPVPCVAVAPSSTPSAGREAAPSGASASVPVVTLDDLPRAPSGSSTAQKGSTAAPVVDEAAETKLLGDAQSAVKSDPAAALRACDEHAKRFPGGSLAQEREALAIEALVRLGRKGEAEKRLARFRAGYPSSGHLRKLEGLF